MNGPKALGTNFVNSYYSNLKPRHLSGNLKGSSSSSYRAGSTDIPDPLSPLLPIVHRPRQVFRTTTCIPHIAAECTFVLVVLLLRGRVWGIHKSTSLMSSSLLLQQCPCMSGSPNLNRFRDRGQVAVQLVSCGVLLPGLVQDCTQHSW